MTFVDEYIDPYLPEEWAAHISEVPPALELGLCFLLAVLLLTCVWGVVRGILGALFGSSEGHHGYELLKAAQRRAEAEAERRALELERLRQHRSASDGLIDASALDAAAVAARESATAAANARLELAEKSLAWSRHEAAKRATEWRAAMKESLQLPHVGSLEVGDFVGSNHQPIHPPLPHFSRVRARKVDKNGILCSPDRVLAPVSPAASARGRGVEGSTRPASTTSREAESASAGVSAADRRRAPKTAASSRSRPIARTAGAGCGSSSSSSSKSRSSVAGTGVAPPSEPTGPVQKARGPTHRLERQSANVLGDIKLKATELDLKYTD
jgi:hypothetical protein